jgi:hypothetical protein
MFLSSLPVQDPKNFSRLALRVERKGQVEKMVETHG